ncbi:MAG TPA: hypothetical protein VFQ06_15020, partial [Nitrospira sp.]|nr:hypothetical protein [Nitrospira sp.]
MADLHPRKDRLWAISAPPTDLTSDLAAWQAQVLTRIHDISPEYRERYAGEDLKHFTQLANSLFHSFGRDLALAQAGFLHHLRASEVEKHLNDDVVDGVTDIIEGQQKFRTLDFSGPKATE